MLCVDCLYIYFPLISQIIKGVYFPLISQINTDLNNIPFLYTLHPTPSTTICVHPCYPWEIMIPLPLHLTPYTFHYYLCSSVSSVGDYIPFLYTLHPTLYTTICVHPCHPWEIIGPFHQKYYPCGTIHTISDKGTIFRAHMQGVGYKNTKFCCFSSKCLHMCKIFCTFVAEMCMELFSLSVLYDLSDLSNSSGKYQ